MSYEPQSEPPRENKFWGRFGFFLLALAPVPLGLLTVNPDHWEGLILGNEKHWSTYEDVFPGVVVIFCIVGCAGLLYKREKKNWEMIAMGVGIGLLLAFVEGYIMAFFGCCHGLSHL